MHTVVRCLDFNIPWYVHCQKYLLKSNGLFDRRMLSERIPLLSLARSPSTPYSCADTAKSPTWHWV